MATRTHFRHTIWRKNPTTGVVEPLQGFECTPRIVSSGGGVGSGAETVFAARTGSTAPTTMETNTSGVISFYTDPGEYSMLFSDTEVPARLSDFSVGHSSTSGAPGGIDEAQLPGAFQSQIDDLLETITDLQATIETLQAQTHQPGDLKPIAYTTPESGWFLCDGLVKTRTSYPLLFAAIGTAFNTGGESGTQFRLPDLRGRTVVGEDAASVRLTSSNDIGQSGGLSRYVIEEDHIPVTVPVAAGSIVDSHTTDSGSDVVPTIFGGGTWDTGAGQYVNNMPPYSVFNWAIKHD